MLWSHMLCTFILVILSDSFLRNNFIIYKYIHREEILGTSRLSKMGRYTNNESKHEF